MFEGYDQERVVNMTAREERWFDNIKKAFHDSDLGMRSGQPEDSCLQSLFKAVDTAKTLRRSLRGEDVCPQDNKKRFIEFLALEVPAFSPEGRGICLETASGKSKRLTIGQIVYEIRCMMVHENENLNVAEHADYHVLFDWSVRRPQAFAELRDGRFILNGFFLYDRLREVIAKFITGIQGMVDFVEKDRFSIGIDPPSGSIKPKKRGGRGLHGTGEAP